MGDSSHHHTPVAERSHPSLPPSEPGLWPGIADIFARYRLFTVAIPVTVSYIALRLRCIKVSAPPTDCSRGWRLASCPVGGHQVPGAPAPGSSTDSRGGRSRGGDRPTPLGAWLLAAWVSMARQL